jgi:hypothetical protein
VIVLLHLWRRNQSRPEVLARIVGIGGGIFMFVVSAVHNWLLWPRSEVLKHMISDFFLSLAWGVWAYFCGWIAVRRLSKQKRYNHEEKARSK